MGCSLLSPHSSLTVSINMILLSAGVKECDRLKGKRSRDFIHFKLKKNKKMRMTTSGEKTVFCLRPSVGL